MLYVFIKLHPICYDFLSRFLSFSHFILHTHNDTEIQLLPSWSTDTFTRMFRLHLWKCWRKKNLSYGTLRQKSKFLHIFCLCILWQYAVSHEEREWEREMEGIGVGEWTWCQRQINAQRINIDLSFWWKTNLKLLLLTYRWEKFKKNVWKTWKLRLINPFINLRISVGVILFSVNLLFDFISFFLFLNLSLISIIINRIGEWKEKKMKWKNTRTESNYNFEYSTYLISLDYLFASVFLENWIYTEQEEWSIDEFWYTVEIRLHAHLNEEYIDFVIINV